MKKFFAFAIAAATMAVGCQKIQDLVNPNHNQAVGEDELVEIKFSSNVVTVKPVGPDVKSISDLKQAGTVYVYGLNDAGDDVTGAKRRELINAEATVGAEDETAEPYTLKLTDAAFYHTSAKYSFYGYYLDEADVTGDLDTEYDQPLTITINGSQDVLLAKGKDNPNYSAVEARDNDKNVELEFKHALSMLTFKAANKGNSEMKLLNVVVGAPLTGTITVVGEQQGCVATDGEAGTINLTTKELVMTSQADVAEVSYTDVKVEGAEGTEVNAEALVFPAKANAKAITLHFQVSQATEGGATETRWIPYTVSQEIAANGHYIFEVDFYSLTEIQIKATLVQWDEVTIPVNTDSIVDGEDPLA